MLRQRSQEVSKNFRSNLKKLQCVLKCWGAKKPQQAVLTTTHQGHHRESPAGQAQNFKATGGQEHSGHTQYSLPTTTAAALHLWEHCPGYTDTGRQHLWQAGSKPFHLSTEIQVRFPVATPRQAVWASWNPSDLQITPLQLEPYPINLKCMLFPYMPGRKGIPLAGTSFISCRW